MCVVVLEEEKVVVEEEEKEEDGRKDGSKVRNAGLSSGLASLLQCMHTLCSGRAWAWA